MINIKLKLLKNTLGQGMISSLIATAIFGILVVSFISFVYIQQVNQKQLQSLSTRSSLIIQIQQSLIDPLALANTFADTNNSILLSCLQGTSCTDTASTTPFLSLRNKNNIILTGSTTAPMRYDYQGNICTTASATCFYEVAAYYTTKCLYSISPCTNTSAFVSISIKIASGVAPVSGFKPRNISIVNYPITFKSMICSEGNFVLGIKSDGSPLCSTRNLNAMSPKQSGAYCSTPGFGSYYNWNLTTGRWQFTPQYFLWRPNWVRTDQCCNIDFLNGSTYTTYTPSCSSME